MNIQKQYLHYILYMLVTSLSISSCSKNEDTDPKPAKFFYYPLNGGSVYPAADLSPNKQMICISPSFEEGFVLLNAKNGELIGHIEEINDEAVPRYQIYSKL